MMSELAPLLPWLLALFAVSAILASVITWFWVAVRLSMSVRRSFLTWFALTANFSTGMEGLAFIIWPLLYLAVCVGAFLGYAFVRTGT